MTTKTDDTASGSARLAPGVWRLGTDFVNYYALEEDGRLTVIDAGMPKFGQTLEAQLGAAGFTPGDVEAVVLTHSDSDHTGVVPPLQAAGARVLIHEADEATLRTPGPKGGEARPSRLLREAWRPSLWRCMATMVRGGAGHPPKIEGATTFGAGERLDVPGRPLVVHAPGHTPGLSALYFEERGVVFVGDVLCTLNPITRARGPQLMPHSFNVSNSQALASLDRLEGIEAGLLLPGHGEPWRDGPRAAVHEARARLGH